MKPRTITSLLVAIATLALSVSPALAWWQFVSYSPSGERKVYTPYRTEKECEAALKQVDGKVAKQYPKLFPRVGSCEEYK
jgi:hypothetical protein